MPEILYQKERKANKLHVCDYCGEIIPVGEVYNHSKLKFDDIYEWKSHLKCITIATALWEYIDPDDNGMSEEAFQDGCFDFCRNFICPACSSFDGDDCNEFKHFCIDKIHEKLLTHDLKLGKGPRGWTYNFRLVPKTDKP